MHCGFFKWSLQADGLRHWCWQWRWDFLLTLKRESLHQCKLTEGGENVAWTWSSEDDTSVFSRFLCWKGSQKKLSLSLSSVYFSCWFKTIFCRLNVSYFVVEQKNCFCRWSLPRCELFCFSVNSKLFLPGFLSLIASLRGTRVVLSLYQYLQIVLLLHSHDRHASSCLIAVPAFKIISLAERYSKVFFVVFKIISVTGRPTSVVLLLDSKLFLS